MISFGVGITVDGLSRLLVKADSHCLWLVGQAR